MGIDLTGFDPLQSASPVLEYLRSLQTTVERIAAALVARAGSEAAYAALAKKYPSQCFFVSCDLNPSTKLGKAAALVPRTHQFEVSIEEQAAALICDGLSFRGNRPQINVFATFAAFMEGIAREGFEFWRYQRNLNGRNEGLNAILHLAHVGACTGRDHFSGWSFDWINLALGYIPFLHRFYAPSDARSAFIAVRDAAANYGGHIVAIPRDNLPVLTKQGTTEPLWQAADPWTPTTVYRLQPGAKVAILTVGAPVLYVGPEPSHLTDILAGMNGSPHIARVAHGKPEAAVAEIKRIDALGTRGDQQIFARTAAKFSVHTLRPQQVQVLERSRL